MKSVCSLHYRILSTLLLCMTLFLASTSFAGKLEELTIRANQGDSIAQFYLASKYHFGQGVPQDYKQAVNWYTKAAEQGEAQSQHNLGFIYNNGQEGVPQDYKQAVKWLTKAAENGFANAQYHLALNYYKGQGVPQDYKQAYNWFSLAAANGEEDAVKARDIAQSKLTPNVLAEAQKETKSIFDKIEASKK